MIAPEPNYTLPVGDKAGHAITLAKVKCTWTKAELAGVALKDEEDVFTSDMKYPCREASGCSMR